MKKTTITPITAEEKPNVQSLTTENLQNDCLYFQATQCTRQLWESGMISTDEYEKIVHLNCKSFKPFLSEIMADISG